MSPLRKISLEGVLAYQWTEDTRTLEFQVTPEQFDRLVEQLPREMKEQALLDRAVETLIARLIGEKFEAELRLRELQLTGHRCSACGTHTRVMPR